MTARVDLGKYVVYDAIASGGMASVHLGRVRGPRGFARTVAIKRLHPELAQDPELSEAFAAEARLAARIRHPNVVSVLDVIAQRGELHLVMEFARAVPLSTLVKRARENGRRIPAKIAVALASAVLSGLEAAHALDVVHRDISPQNVLVGADGVPRIVDFGIAKVESQATRGKALKGKPSYMAPEQLRGESGDRRVDVYATSVVLWELITGVRLFGGDNDHAVLLKVLEKPVDAPSRIVGELPKELDAITLRGLARDPAERFGSAREMIAALEHALPAASAGEIGKFVDELCRADLELLDQRAAAAEAAGEESAEARAPRKRSWLAGAALLVLMGALGATLLALRSRAAPELEPARPQPQQKPAPVLPPMIVPSTTAAPASAPSAESSPTPTRRPTAPALRSAGSARPAPKPDCDPPYVIDSEGYHRMKPECL